MKRTPGERLDFSLSRLHGATRDRRPTGVRHDEADDVDGSVNTDDALAFDPIPLLKAFAARGVRVVVIGQVAGILHGSLELTGDLDLLWDGNPAQHQALSLAFSDVDATLLDADGAGTTGDPFDLPKVLFSSPICSGDLCTPRLPWGSLPIHDIMSRARAAAMTDGTEIRYIVAADLILMRRAAGRPKDLRRAIELEQITSG